MYIIYRFFANKELETAKLSLIDLYSKTYFIYK